jgi:hypothetical protein
VRQVVEDEFSIEAGINWKSHLHAEINSRGLWIKARVRELCSEGKWKIKEDLTLVEVDLSPGRDRLHYKIRVILDDTEGQKPGKDW